ncbi:MAG: plastocyanin/azurin family copper-binding protein [Thermoleophilaceae bacterium]
MRFVVPAILAAAALASAPAASADDVIHAAPTLRYSPSRVTIDQGEKVVFENDDSVEHNVVSADYAPDGSRLFRSDTIGGGLSTSVSGTEYLTTGDYDFFCSLHRGMRGVLSVTGAGAPLPRPQTPDTTLPGLKLRLFTRSARTALARRSLLVHLKATEYVRVAVVARARGRTIARRTAVVPRAGFRGARLRLTRRGRKLLRRAARIRVSIRGLAVDRAGNRRRARTRSTIFGR